VYSRDAAHDADEDDAVAGKKEAPAATADVKMENEAEATASKKRDREDDAGEKDGEAKKVKSEA
jgi:hypothetical protein